MVQHNPEQPAGESELSHLVIGAAIEVHRALGPGLLESAYARCLARELELQRIEFDCEVEIPVTYKGVRLECGYRADLIVANSMIVEVKAVESLSPRHTAQLLTYLRLTRLSLGLIFNFHTSLLKSGIKRVVNSH